MRLLLIPVLVLAFFNTWAGDKEKQPTQNENQPGPEIFDPSWVFPTAQPIK